MLLCCFSVKYHRQGTQVSGANVLIFIPRLSHTTFALHEPIALWTSSPEASLTLSSAGRVSCTGATSIHVSPARSDLLARTTILSALHLRPLDVFDEHVLALISTPEQAPSRVSFIPLQTGKREVKFSFDDLVGSEVTMGHALYAPLTKSVLYLSPGSKGVAVNFGPLGGECLLSPVYASRSTSSSSWGLSLLTPHAILPPPEPVQRTVVSQFAALEVGEPEEEPETEPNPDPLPESEPALDPETDKFDTEPFESESERPPTDSYSQTTVSAPASEHGESQNHRTEVSKRPSPPPLQHIVLLLLRVVAFFRILVLGRFLHIVSVPEKQGRSAHEQDGCMADGGADEETSLLIGSKSASLPGYGSVEEKLKEDEVVSSEVVDVTQDHVPEKAQSENPTEVEIEVAVKKDIPSPVPYSSPEPETKYGLPLVTGEGEQTVRADAVVPPVARASLSFSIPQGDLSLIFFPNVTVEHISGKEADDNASSAKTYEIELFVGDERLDLKAEQLRDESNGALLLEVPGVVSNAGVLDVFVREIVV